MAIITNTKEDDNNLALQLMLDKVKDLHPGARRSNAAITLNRYCLTVEVHFWLGEAYALNKMARLVAESMLDPVFDIYFGPRKAVVSPLAYAHYVGHYSARTLIVKLQYSGCFWPDDDNNDRPKTVDKIADLEAKTNELEERLSELETKHDLHRHGVTGDVCFKDYHDRTHWKVTVNTEAE